MSVKVSNISRSRLSYYIFREKLIKKRIIGITCFVKESKKVRPANSGWRAGVIMQRIYIIPPMPPPGGIGGMADLSSGFSATIASVVSISPAMDAAF